MFTLALVAVVVVALVRGNTKDGALVALFAAVLAAFSVSTLWHSGNPHVRALVGPDRHLFRAKLHEQAGRKAMAIEALAAHERVFPGNLQAITKRATLLMNAGRHEEALEELDKAMAPFSQPALIGVRAFLRLQSGQAEAALEDALPALEKGDQCAARQAATSSLILLRRLETALEIADAAPADHSICLTHARGEALRLLRRTEEALECFRLVVEDRDGRVGAGDKIDALGHLGRHEEAQTLLKRVEAAGSAAPGAEILVQLRSGDPDSVRAAIAAALERGPAIATNTIGDPEFSHLLGEAGVREAFVRTFRNEEGSGSRKRGGAPRFP